jgi:inner membrane protein
MNLAAADILMRGRSPNHVAGKTPSTPDQPMHKAPFPPALYDRWGTLLKMAGVLILILLLLIPLSMIRSVLQERLGRRNAAVADITSSWGRDQKIIGPVLVVPYRSTIKSWKEQPAGGGRTERVEVIEMMVANAYFLPTNLVITSHITPRKLRRGIYEAVVYSGKLEISGLFSRPDFGSLRIEEANVMWEDALVALAIPDLRGVRETLNLSWGAGRYPLLPGSKLKGFPAGIFARIGSLNDGNAAEIPFNVELTLNGSSRLGFAPVGARNSVRVSSPWPDPSFYGAILPGEREVTRDGFEASWQVTYYSRDHAQQWTDQDPASGLDHSSAEASLFGVAFLSGIDAYRNTERAIKYGALFIVLIFAAFFLFEVLAALRIHPFQYIIVGVALCLFYLGLLSLSEFIPFALAYFLSAAVTMLLICFHSAKMLKSGSRTLIIAGMLAGIYSYLYFALQLQDYALLLGTAGLFLMLGIVIYVTRKIDWYGWDKRSSGAVAGEAPLV